jgi:hypothetical protein
MVGCMLPPKSNDSATSAPPFMSKCDIWKSRAGVLMVQQRKKWMGYAASNVVVNFNDLKTQERKEVSEYWLSRLPIRGKSGLVAAESLALVPCKAGLLW